LHISQLDRYTLRPYSSPKSWEKKRKRGWDSKLLAIPSMLTTRLSSQLLSSVTEISRTSNNKRKVPSLKIEKERTGEEDVNVKEKIKSTNIHIIGSPAERQSKSHQLVKRRVPFFFLLTWPKDLDRPSGLSHVYTTEQKKKSTRQQLLMSLSSSF
jgi:hypothetical protein